MTAKLYETESASETTGHVVDAPDSARARSIPLLIAMVLTLFITLGVWSHPGLRVPIILAVLLAALVISLCARERRTAVPVLLGLTWLVFAVELVDAAARLWRMVAGDYADVSTSTHPAAPGSLTAIAAAGGIVVLFAVLCVLPWWPRGRNTLFACFVASYGALMVLVMRVVDFPLVDVPLHLRAGAHAMLHGHSPYGVTIPYIFGSQPASHFYGPGLVVHDRVLIGYQYLPANLFLDAPTYLLLGDERFVRLAALIASAALMWRMTRDTLGRLCVVLLLLPSTTTFMLLTHSMEPLFAFFFAVTLFGLWSRRGPVVIWALAATLASKQYAAALVPLALVVARLGRTRWLIAAGALAALVIAGFAAWDLGGFWRSAILYQFQQPVRFESLSLTVALLASGVAVPSWVMGIGSLIAALGVATLLGRRGHASVARLSLSCAAALLTLALLSKQGQMNYYWLVCTLLLYGVAIPGERETRASRDHGEHGRREAIASPPDPAQADAPRG